MLLNPINLRLRTRFLQAGFVFLCIMFFHISFAQRKQSAKNSSTENRILRVGVYNEPPEIFIDSDGEPKGLFIDLLEYIAKKQDLNIEYIHSEWPVLIDWLKKGEIDVLPNVSFTNERDSLLLLNELPILTSWLEIYSDKNTKVHSVKDLNRKKVGVLQNSVVEEYLEKKIEEHTNLRVEKVFFADYSGMVAAIKNKKIDAFIADRFFRYSKLSKNDVYSTGVVFHPISIHFAFAKNAGNAHVLNAFNGEIALLRGTSGSQYYKSVHRWLGGYFDNYIPWYIEWMIGLLFAFLTLALLYALIGKRIIRAKNNSLRLSNQTLVKAIDESQESNRMKTAFLQNISHEIRTPMNGIVGFMNLLKEPGLDKETRNEFMDLLNESGQRLLNTVDEIVEISKLESGAEQNNFAATNVELILLYFIQFYTPQATKKGVTIRLSDERDTVKAPLIKTDKKKLESILTGLLNNAIKFTETGSIEIGNYLEKGMLVFYVKDSGIGIPADRREVIFERFVQAECSINREYEGVGLGLTIAKGYVEALQGKIWLHSKEGEGSTFFFSIPYCEARDEITDIGSAKLIPANETILLAGDDETNYLYCKYLLQREGFKLIHVPDGISAAETIQKETGISLVLIDIKIPVMEGFEAIRRIRQINKTIPVIVQTAHGFLRDKEKALEAGCTEYLTKPASSEKLIRIIKRHLVTELTTQN